MSTTLEEVQKLNRELAERINEEARSNPQSPYTGKYVGIVNGQVVFVTDDFKALYYRLREIEPDQRRAFWVDAGHDPNEIEYVWSC
jgi:hypoxanthine-guanine phosphoribosyltransferase